MKMWPFLRDFFLPQILCTHRKIGVTGRQTDKETIMAQCITCTNETVGNRQNPVFMSHLV